MKNRRKAWFSGSWYPQSDESVTKQIEQWNTKLTPNNKTIISGIVPHAGWFFSGKLAYDVIRRFSKDIDLLIVLGGHMPWSGPALYWGSEVCETPCGDLPVHGDFLFKLIDQFPMVENNDPDNTIEVQLPIIRNVLGSIPIVPIRVTAGPQCLEFMDILIQVEAEMELDVAILGSTDLTHYGPNYSFEPKESQDDPHEWVERRDRAILEKMDKLDALGVLEHARENQSACSAGAAACAAYFAKKKGMKSGEILAYDTSYSKHPASSFVGYGTVIYGS